MAGTMTCPRCGQTCGKDASGNPTAHQKPNSREQCR